jgi:hypothetical protein
VEIPVLSVVYLILVFQIHLGMEHSGKDMVLAQTLTLKGVCENSYDNCPYGNLRGLHNGLDFPGRKGDVLIWAGTESSIVSAVQNSGSGDALPNIRFAYNNMITTYGHIDLSKDLVKTRR